MAKLKNVFQRRETKYLLSYENYHQLRQALVPYMEADEYGKHTIISVYYDTDDFQLIRWALEKPDFREKFRLRSYGVPTAETPVYLEIKKKVGKIIYKRRLSLPYDDAKNFNCLSPDFSVSGVQNQQIKREIQWLACQRQLRPQVMIAYDRIAMKAFDEELAEFRITFDFDIRFRQEELDLRQGDYGQRVAPELDVLMEVKALGAYPLWFSKLLSQLGIQRGSFSKYAQTYQRYLMDKQETVRSVTQLPAMAAFTIITPTEERTHVI